MNILGFNVKKIALLIPENCYAPEIYALKNYLDNIAEEDIKADLLSFSEFLTNQFNYDFVYRMMGFSSLFFNEVKIPEIHDYASLSTGKFNNVKDFIKKKFQKKPIHRLFLNEEVKNRMNFKDGISYSYRDMGVDSEFFNINKVDVGKKYDFCYIGSITDDRNIDKLLNIFIERSDVNICLVGDNNLSNKDKYIGINNILFLGKKDRQGVLEVLTTSKIGINYTPDIFPFNKQTSTKVLEYIAAGLDVVSNHYCWINNLEESIGGRFWDINDLNNNVIYSRDISELSKKVKKWDDIFDGTNLKKVILGK